MFNRYTYILLFTKLMHAYVCLVPVWNIQVIVSSLFSVLMKLLVSFSSELIFKAFKTVL